MLFAAFSKFKEQQTKPGCASSEVELGAGIDGTTGSMDIDVPRVVVECTYPVVPLSRVS